MAVKNAYLVVDIGTGNVRVVVVGEDTRVLGEARADIQYHRDEMYPDSIYFEPNQLWKQLIGLGKEAISRSGDIKINAVISTSQREGIVLIDQNGNSILGMPNIDHRGREWESNIQDKNCVYELTGRYPTSLFSAMKLVGIREKKPETWNNIDCFLILSISDWVDFMFTGEASYEHSQASETLLFDVQENQWSDELCFMFSISKNMLPPVKSCGTVLGKITSSASNEWSLSKDTVVIKGGGDTQLAIKSTQPLVDDVVIVSGTTTPIVKLVDQYITDPEMRTWTSRDIQPNRFVFEANAGVTGLNFQRLKEVFYPNEGYEVIEEELSRNQKSFCTATLGSLIASEKFPVIQGGFIFSAPVSHELTRSCFVRATLYDIAFSIAENYSVLNELSVHEADYVWACGGGLQSKTLRQMIANILGKKVKVRKGFHQSSAVGGALICNEALSVTISAAGEPEEVVSPEAGVQIEEIYQKWKQSRNFFRKTLEPA
jgi:autoinducer 2 (AI-2) kinase